MCCFMEWKCWVALAHSMHGLQAGWNSYYMFENQCNQSDTQGWEVRLMLFNAMVVQMFLYGAKLWGGIISLSAWNEIGKFKICSYVEILDLNPQHYILPCC